MIKELTFEVALSSYAQPLPIPAPDEPLATTVQFTMIKELTSDVALPTFAQPLPIPEP
jgi:hypothetical protein